MNATQLAGLFGFGLAVFAALAARPEPWRGLAAAHAGLWIDVLCGLRYSVHHVTAQLSPAEYAGRRPFQVAAIVVVLLIVAVIFARIGRTAATSPQHRWAWLLTAMVMALVLIEMISLHAVDAVMYTKLLGIKLIGWGWLCCGCGVALCAVGSRIKGKI